MSEGPDFSILDRPEVIQFIFYPRRDWTPLPPGARDYVVPVAEGVSIACRFYPAEKTSPCFLYFHGNGEVACDHDWIAPLYNQDGIGLFVADYRGYGKSGGSPSFAAMTADAHALFRSFVDTLRSEGYSGPLFVMGRSLGSHSTLELAYHYPEALSGIIIESGSANMARLLRFFDVPEERRSALEEAGFHRLRSITLPILILHGEWDTLIPLAEAVRLYEGIGSPEKRLEVVPAAGHNDILLVGTEQYFSAIREFVFTR